MSDRHCFRCETALGAAIICASCAALNPVHRVTPFQESGRYNFSTLATDQTDSTGPPGPENDYPTYVGWSAESRHHSVKIVLRTKLRSAHNPGAVPSRS